VYGPEGTPQLQNGLFGQEISVMLNNKVLLNGVFWSSLSSQNRDSLVLLDSVMFPVTKELKLAAKYPDNGQIELSKQADLKEYFKSIGKLSVSNDQKIKNSQITQNWCANPMSEKVPEDKTKLWISSDNYQGMNHAPSVRHICRGEKELFYLLMDWDDKAVVHTGRLIVVTPANTFPPLPENIVTAFPVSSANKDPEVKIIENKNKESSDQVLVSIDGKIIIYDEVKSTFRSQAN
jgi:hypothetical protein